jgi:hypothetical protein
MKNLNEIITEAVNSKSDGTIWAHREKGSESMVAIVWNDSSVDELIEEAQGKIANLIGECAWVIIGYTFEKE